MNSTSADEPSALAVAPSSPSIAQSRWPRSSVQRQRGRKSMPSTTPARSPFHYHPAVKAVLLLRRRDAEADSGCRRRLELTDIAAEHEFSSERMPSPE